MAPPLPVPRARRGGRRTARAACAALASLALLSPAAALAAPVAVRHWEGVAHGFLALRTLEGAHLADGELVETAVPTAHGNRVRSRLTLRFADGSLHQETTVYVQRRVFRLVSNHVLQKGPAFKRQLESNISASGRVTVRWADEDGKEHTSEDHLDLPRDVSNGLIMALLKNVSPDAPKTTVSMVAITPKPRVVQLEIAAAGEEPFAIGASHHKAMHYVLKVHVPGVTGAIASILGKVPPDSHVWMATGEAPTFVKAELALYVGGPTWRIELASATWPPGAAAAKDAAEAKEAQDGGKTGNAGDGGR